MGYRIPHGTIPKIFVTGQENLEIRGQVETVQTTALLKSLRKLRSVLETWRDFLSFKLQWKIISERWCEKHIKEYKNKCVYAVGGGKKKKKFEKNCATLNIIFIVRRSFPRSQFTCLELFCEKASQQ